MRVTAQARTVPCCCSGLGLGLGLTIDGTFSSTGALATDPHEFSARRLSTLSSGVARGTKDMLTGGNDVLNRGKDFLMDHTEVVREKGRRLLHKVDRFNVFKEARGLVNPLDDGAGWKSSERHESVTVGVRFSSVRISFIGIMEDQAEEEIGNWLISSATVVDGNSSSGVPRGETKPRSEICLVSLDGVGVKAIVGEEEQRAELCIRYIQVDNQEHSTTLPVMLTVEAREDSAHPGSITLRQHDPQKHRPLGGKGRGRGRGARFFFPPFE